MLINMSKRGEVALYIFLAFAVIAAIGMIYTMLNSGAEGMYYSGQYVPERVDPREVWSGTSGGELRQYAVRCQGRCFGNEPGESQVGQEPLAGRALQQCLADCQAGIPRERHEGQACYTCSCQPPIGMTAEDEKHALEMCQKSCGSAAKIIGEPTSGLCKY